MRRNLLTYAAATLLTLTACHHHEDEPDNTSERTVLVYMSGENSLSANVGKDLTEMLAAKTDSRNDCLLAYVDELNSTHVPYLTRIVNGEKKDSVSLRDMGISTGDANSADPAVMKAIINYAFRKYPSRTADYGLVLWGHASGWVVDDDSIATTAAARSPRRAYGIDSGKDSKDGKLAWINISSLAEVLRQVPHLKFIFADCCNFQCLETLYELRHCADYIIGSPAEIPDDGAPYHTVAPAMFERDSFYTKIIDRYYRQMFSDNKRVPLSAVKTSAIDALAKATRTVLETMKDTLSQTPYPNMNGLIHYYRSPLHYDANDFIMTYAKKEDYEKWKEALNEAVVYKKMATIWVTDANWYYNYGDFTVTEENYGGVSMFVPQNPSVRAKYGEYNAAIRKTAWYYAVGLKNLGW